MFSYDFYILSYLFFVFYNIGYIAFTLTAPSVLLHHCLLAFLGLNTFQAALPSAGRHFITCLMFKILNLITK